MTEVPPSRPVRLHVGNRATVDELPRIADGFAEFVVRDVEGDLRAIAAVRSSRDLPALDAQGGGSGVWFLRVGLAKPGAKVNARIVNGQLELEAAPGDAVRLRMAVQPPTLEEILAGKLPEAPQPDRRLVLTFLGSGGMSMGIDPWGYRPTIDLRPKWLPPTDWEAIDRARTSMLEAPTESARIQAAYRLGLHYLDFGFAKEARYYFKLVERNRGPVQERDLELAMAQSSLSAARWDEARAHYKRAAELGVPRAGIIEGLAVVSLATNDPPRAPMGRALAGVTARPDALALAAELLQRDGYFRESRPVLEALYVRNLTLGEARGRIGLRLGDARAHDNDLEGAIRVWQEVGNDVANLRVKLAELLRGDPSVWPLAVPDLVVLAHDRSEAGAEGLYLLAQIDLVVGGREDAITELAQLMQRHPAQSLGSDVPERFWGAYSTHVADMAALGRWIDIAALHERVWHRVVRRAVDSPDALALVARAYEEVGLPDRAVIALRDAVAVLLDLEQDDPEMVLRLAALYGKTGNWKDGLRTLEYLGGMDFPPERNGEVALLEASLYEEAGEHDKAALALRRAALQPDYRDEATVRLAVMDAEAGRCRRATPTLERLLFSPQGEANFQDPRPWVGLARCLAARGDQAGAARAAKAAASRSESEAEVRYATYLAAVASQWSDAAAVEALAAGDDIWAAMAREQRDAQAFEQELEARKGLSP